MQARQLAHFSCALMWACVLGCAPALVVAQNYPTKPVRMILSYPPGGGTDLLARTVSQKLTEKWSQSVVVDNRSGGNGVVGARAAITATPDGYTLYVGAADHLVLAPNLISNL